MKRLLQILTLLSGFAIPCAGQVTKVSQVPTTNTVNQPDLVLIDSTNGSGGYGTRTITVANLAMSSPFTNITAALIAVGSTNADNFDAPLTAQQNSLFQGTHISGYGAPNSIGETWINLNNWAANSLVVSNGAVYDSVQANPSGGNQSFVIPSTGEFRIVGSITLPSNAGSGSAYCWIGITSDTAGATPPAGDGNALAIGLDWGNQTNNITHYLAWNKGTATEDTTSLQPGTYTVDIFGDTNEISLAILAPGHTNQFQLTFSRASFGNVNNLHVWNSDPRRLTGMAINALGARASCETVSGRIGEGSNDFILNSVDTAGTNIQIWVPSFYDSRRAFPLILFCHGAGWTETFPWTGQSLGGTNGFPERNYFQTLVNAGYIIASSGLGGDNWGNQAGTGGVSNLLAYVRAHFNVGAVIPMGASMGELTAANFIDQHSTEVAGNVALYGDFNLGWTYNNTSYTTAINTAYNIPGGGTYAVETAGYDPILVNPRRFYRVPVVAFASPSDGTLSYASNSAAFTTKQAGWAGQVLLYAKSGGHGDPSQYDAPSTLSFLKSFVGNLATNPPVSGYKTIVNSAWFPDQAGGNGGGIYNIQAVNIVGGVVTNTQPSATFGGITTSSPGVSGPSQYVFGGQYTFSSGGNGYQFNNQGNSAALLNVTESGELVWGATNAAPNTNATPVRWINVIVGGTTYDLPLYH